MAAVVAADSSMSAGATALEIPSDRPAFHTRAYFDGPPAANAVFLPQERRTTRPESVKVYFPNTNRTCSPDPELSYLTRRLAYAYITPKTSRATPTPTRRPSSAASSAPSPSTCRRPSSSKSSPSTYGDVQVRFRTPDDREAAMRRQPFELDGATVTLVRYGEIPNARRVTYDYIVHVALRLYPAELCTEKMIQGNCTGFGFLREIDPASFAGPDLATVRVVLQLQHPREIPRQLRIEISKHSYDADGQYVRVFQAQGAAA